MELGCLGIEGKGKAPHWRLTELGTTSKTSSSGVAEPPTRDYLTWDYVPWKRPADRRRPRFDRFLKNKTPLLTPKRSATGVDNTPAMASIAPDAQSATGGVHIQDAETATGVDNISSNHSTGARAVCGGEAAGGWDAEV